MKIQITKFRKINMSDSVWILHYRDLSVSKKTELMNKMGKKLKKNILNNYFNTLCVYLCLFEYMLWVFFVINDFS